jgi:hypothetical protein
LAVGYTREKKGRERIAWWRDPKGQQLRYNGWHNFPPAFTRSLDAAVTLVPEGWTWARYHSGAVECMTLNGPGGSILFERGEGNSSALALCAAALRARAAMAQPSSDT